MTLGQLSHIARINKLTEGHWEHLMYVRRKEKNKIKAKDSKRRKRNEIEQKR